MLIEHISSNTLYNLNHKQLGTHGYILSAVANDALVLKHQTISIHSADKIFIVLDYYRAEMLHLLWTTLGNKITFWIKIFPVVLGLALINIS